MNELTEQDELKETAGLASPAERCVMLREKQGITQAELARRSGISGAAISLLEKGDRDPVLTTAISISNALGVSLDVFAGLKQLKQDELRIEIVELKQKLKNIKVLAT